MSTTTDTHLFKFPSYAVADGLPEVLDWLRHAGRWAGESRIVIDANDRKCEPCTQWVRVRVQTRPQDTNDDVWQVAAEIVLSGPALAALMSTRD